MKKCDLNRLALLGVASGLIVLCQSTASAAESQAPDQTKSADKSADKKADKNNDKNADDGNLGYHLYTEDELLLELNDQGIALYNSLDAKGKALARYVASQRCNSTNVCQGLNACATDKNPCAGKGPCKAQGKCAIADKNLAVKIVADKLAKKTLRS